MEIMNKGTLAAAVVLFVVCAASAQDVAGDWQGTLHAGAADLHLVLHITKGGWRQPQGYSLSVGPVSRREGTRDFQLPDQIQNKKNTDRSAKLLENKDLRFRISMESG